MAALSKRARKIKRKRESRRKVDPKKTMAVAAVASTAAFATATAASGSGSEINRKSDYFAHLALKGDRPFSDQVILSAHNMGPTYGSTTPSLLVNQRLSIKDALEKTPIHGLQMDVYEYNGELVLNHSSIEQQGEPIYLKDALRDIEEFSRENPDTPLFINIENHVKSPEGRKEMAGMINSSMGESIYGGEFNADTTPNDVVLSGKPIILSGHNGYEDSSGHNFNRIMNDEGLFIRDSGGLNRHLGSQVSEDRTVGLGGAGASQIIGSEHNKIDTDDVDGYLEASESGPGNGKFVWLDQVSPKDPRFYTPEDRSSLFTPAGDVSVTQFEAYPSSEKAGDYLIALELSAATFSTTLGVAVGALGIYNNFKLIKSAKEAFSKEYLDFDLDKLPKERKKQKYKGLADHDIVAKKTMNKLLNQTFFRTFSSGLSAVTAISAGIFAIGLVIPPAAPILMTVALVTAGVGLGVTSASALLTRRLLRKKIGKLAQYKHLEDKLKSQHGKESEKDRSAEHAKAAEYTGRFALLFRVSKMGKYALPLSAVIASVAISAIEFVNLIIGAVVNHKKRKKRYNNLKTAVNEAIKINFQKKRFILFGKTKFRRLVEKNFDLLKKFYGDEFSQLAGKEGGVEKFIESVEGDNDRLAACKNLLRKIELNKEFSKFVLSKKDLSKSNFDEQLSEYLCHKLEAFDAKDLRSATLAGSMKALSATGVIGATFPVMSLPAAVVGAVVILGGVVASTVGATIVKRAIRKKFKQAISDFDSERQIPLIKRISEIKSDLISAQDLSMRTGAKSESMDSVKLDGVELGRAHRGLKDVKIDKRSGRPNPVAWSVRAQQSSKKGEVIGLRCEK